MSDRRLLVGLGLVVAVLAVVLTVLTVSGGGKGAGPALTGALPTAPLITTAASVPPTTGSEPQTTTAPVLPTTTSAAATITVDVPISGAGALLTPPTAPDIRREDAPNDCASLVDNGWESLDCKATALGAGGLTYVIEALPLPSAVATRAYIFRQEPDGWYQVLLRAEDDSGTHYVASEVEAAVVPITGSAPVIVVGFLEDNGSLLAMDVVAPSGVVAAHRDLPDGAVLPSGNGFETWSGPTQPGGSVYTHDTIADVGGAWRIVARQQVPSEDVPQARNLLA